MTLPSAGNSNKCILVKKHKYSDLFRTEKLKNKYKSNVISSYISF